MRKQARETERGRERESKSFPKKTTTTTKDPHKKVHIKGNKTNSEIGKNKREARNYLAIKNKMKVRVDLFCCFFFY